MRISPSGQPLALSSLAVRHVTVDEMRPDHSPPSSGSISSSVCRSVWVGSIRINPAILKGIERHTQELIDSVAYKRTHIDKQRKKQAAS